MRLKGVPPPLLLFWLGVSLAVSLPGCYGIDVESEATTKVDTDEVLSEKIETSVKEHEQVQTGAAGNVPKSTGVEAAFHSSIQAGTDAHTEQTSHSIEKSAAEELKTTSSVVATPSLPSDIGTSEEVLIRTENDKPKVQPTKPVIQISKTVEIEPGTDAIDTHVTVEPSTGDDGDIPMPTSYSPDHLDGYPEDFYPIPSDQNNDETTVKEHTDKFWKHNMGRTTYTVVPTKSLQAIDMTTPVYDRINPNRVGLIDETTEDIDHFLANRASRNKLTGGPLNPAASNATADQDRPRINRRQSGQQSVEQLPLASPRTSNNDDNENLEKSARVADRDDEGPKINDILSGLLSVVGEGLSFATNYVQEQNKRKQQLTTPSDLPDPADQNLQDLDQDFDDQADSLFPTRNRTRVNNRGPPKLSGIPFEAIPLEVLGNKLPGSSLIPQRPFQTRLPGGGRPVPPPGQQLSPPPLQPLPPNSNKPPLNLSLPNRLFPNREKPNVPDGSTNSPLPTRPGYEPEFLSPAPPKVNISNTSGDNLSDTTVAELAAEIAIIESLLKGGSNENSLTTEKSVFTNVENEPEELAVAATLPDRNNILQNNLSRPKGDPTSSTTTSRPTTPSLPPSGPQRPTSELPGKRPTAIISAQPQPLNPRPENRPLPPQRLPGPQNRPQPPPGGAGVNRPFIEPSYAPILVTPPPKNGDFNRPVPPYIRGRPPPRPDGVPPTRPVAQRPSSAIPTPALPGRPLVYPTRPLKEEIITGVAIPAENEFFDLTVTAQQNFGGKPTIQKIQNYGGIITKAQPGDDYVSIDGKRTYFDIGPGRTSSVAQSRTPIVEVQPTKSLAGKGSVIGATLKIGGEDVFNRYEATAVPVKSLLSEQNEAATSSSSRTRDPSLASLVPGVPTGTGTRIKPGPTRRPQAPPVRIDTCIVGDNNTCKSEYHEVCLTMLGVSSCYCKPGYGRKHHRHKCKNNNLHEISHKRRIPSKCLADISKHNDKQLIWNSGYTDPDSDEFQILEGEASYAIDSAMSLTSLSNLYMGTSINTFYPLANTVTVNTTLELLENGYTTSNLVKRDLEKKLARGNNIGDGNLYVAGLYNPIPEIKDLDECLDPVYNDCGENSICINTFGGFICECKKGYGDRYAGDAERSGRECESCPDDHCNSRGTCSVLDGNRVCQCEGNYYGDQCEVDGEVLAVAVGASVAAVIIILLTLICLCMWSRRWKREQEKVELSRGYSRPFIVGTLPPPPSTYHTKMPPAPTWAPPPTSNIYGTRWPEPQQNIYASVMFHGSQEPLYMSPSAVRGQEPVYMSPLEPPLSVYGTSGLGAGGTVSSNGGGHSLYGTMPRVYPTRHSGGTLDFGSQFTAARFPTQYATFRKEKLGARPSLRSLGLMEEDESEDKVRVLEDMEAQHSEEEDSTSDSESSVNSLKEKLKDENLTRITRGITFQTLRRSPSVATTTITNMNTSTNLHYNQQTTRQANHHYTAEPGVRRVMGLPPVPGRNNGGNNRNMAPLPPISTIPRPNTSMGQRAGSHPLLDTSESEETEASAAKLARPRSSMLMGTVNLEDDFETDYPRFSGTIGVRNPRFVAAMRNAYVQQQHIQMNMMNRFKQ